VPGSRGAYQNLPRVPGIRTVTALDRMRPRAAVHHAPPRVVAVGLGHELIEAVIVLRDQRLRSAAHADGDSSRCRGFAGCGCSRSWFIWRARPQARIEHDDRTREVGM